MDIDNYLTHLAQFHEINQTPQDLNAIVQKLHEETGEVLAAYSVHGKSTELLREFADAANVAIWGIVKCGGKYPLYEGYKKLIETTEKYAAQRKEETP